MFPTADSQPLSLKEICRSMIRIQLRTKAESENPNIKLGRDAKKHRDTRKTRYANSSCRSRPIGKKCTRRFVIPIFEESDATSDETSSNNSHKEVEVESSTNNSFPSRIVAAAASSISAVFQQVISTESDSEGMETSSVASHSRDNEVDNTENTTKDTNGLPNSNKQVENGFDLNPQDMDLAEDDSEPELMTTIERTKRSISITGNNHFLVTQKKTCLTLNLLLLDEEDDLPSQPTDNNMETKPSSSSSSSSIFPLHRIRRATGLIFKRVALADFDSDSDTSSCEPEATVSVDKTDESDEETDKRTSEDDLKVYYNLMKQNINALPLPHVLKHYLNYHRDL